MPREVDVLAPPQRVAEQVVRWEEALDALVPTRTGGPHVRIATWNLRAFRRSTKAWTTREDASPERNFTDVHLIGAVLRRFDVIAVQEVRGNLRAVRHLMKVLGEEWAFILTDVTEGKDGNPERLAFLFDTRRVKLSGLACELVVPLEQEAGVGPGRGSWTGSSRVLFGDHAAEREPELRAIAQWLAGWAEQEFGWDHNLIALGDCNVDRVGDPLIEAFTSTGLVPTPQLAGLPARSSTTRGRLLPDGPSAWSV
ncbi:endonuclease/exonuclease/phosphatase family protein [Streptomyces sp. NPDC054940]